MNFLLIIGVCLLGARATFWLSHRTPLGSIRAATLASLAFVAVTSPWGWLIIPKLQTAFFGSTFVGMSDLRRLSERHILLAAVIFGGFFWFLSQFKPGVGGSLGASAFVACVLAHLVLGRPGPR